MNRRDLDRCAKNGTPVYISGPIAVITAPGGKPKWKSTKDLIGIPLKVLKIESVSQFRGGSCIYATLEAPDGSIIAMEAPGLSK